MTPLIRALLYTVPIALLLWVGIVGAALWLIGVLT